MSLKLARTLLKELKAHGHPEAHLEQGGRHPRLVVTIDGKPRFYVVPSTPGDWRSEANARAGMKRAFGIRPQPARQKPEPAARPSARRPKLRRTPTLPAPPPPVAEPGVDQFYATLAALRAALANGAGTPP